MSQKQSHGFSLRYKLLIVLTVLPLVSLGLYLLMATRLFERDKVAYVFDSSVTVSRSLSVQTRLEIENFVARVKPILEGWDINSQRFVPIAQTLFDKQKEILKITILTHKQDGGFKVTSELHQPGQEPLILDAAQIRFVTEADEKGLALHMSAEKTNQFSFAQRVGEKGAPQSAVYVANYQSKDFVEAFLQKNLYRSFLLDATGNILIGSIANSADLFQSQAPREIFASAVSSQTPEGTGEVKISEKQNVLMSYSHVPVGNFIVASIVDKKEALKAVDVLVVKSLLFFIALLASTVIISLIASVQLTSTLRQLFEATQKVAQGQFDIQIRSSSRDEIGGLANSFNLMAKEVARLLSETAEKARMANELATVRTVQETLFPQAHKKFGAFEVVGHFEPASECGGDWWNYYLSDNKLYCWIGDATGHGASAALITSAARSASAIIEMMTDITPASALKIMNRAIGETSKGKIMMTFFICTIDLQSGLMTYSSASHDPPYILRRPEGRKMKRADLQALIDGSGPRLGDQANPSYEDVTVQLVPGDILFLYTDGILDLINPKGEVWGERMFLNSLISSTDNQGQAVVRMENLKADIQKFRQNATLLDDITLFMCQYEKPMMGVA